MRNPASKSVRPAEFYSAVTQSKNNGENHRWAHRPQALCSSCAIKLCPMAISRRLQALCLLASNLAPDNVLVISTVDKRVNFPALIITEQNSPLDAFAKEKLGCFRK